MKKAKIYFLPLIFFLFPFTAFGQSERWKPLVVPTTPPTPPTNKTDNPQQTGPQLSPPPGASPARIVRHTTSGRSDLDRLYEQAALKYSLDVNVLIEQGRVESINFNPGVISGKIVSPAGAVGISQFMQGTAIRYGLQVRPGRDDRTNPELAIDAQARYLRDLLKLFGGRYDLAIAAYNCGEHRSALREGRIPRIPETMNYTSRILGRVKQATTKGPISFFSGVRPEKIPENRSTSDQVGVSVRFLH